ncbi:MAG: hypothetical protein HOP04_13565 [Methylophilaceae bacterium]|nr:hypothetical protein [Methylophilaceae bacterium]
MANTPIKSDPIKKVYYDPIELSDKFLGILFWISAVLSFFIAFIDIPSNPKIYSYIQIAFFIFVLLTFALDIFNRLYLKPRADDMRMKDFLSHAYGIPLNHSQTYNYYNNNETIPIRKIAAQLLENSMHSKSTALEMAKKTRLITVVYIAIFFIICINRTTAFEIISIAAQIIFGEHILSSLIRTEWTRIRHERVYEDIYNLFQFNPAKEQFEIKTLEGLTKYETTKANGGVLLSSKVFDSNNTSVSDDWDKLRSKLNIL